MYADPEPPVAGNIFSQLSLEQLQPDCARQKAVAHPVSRSLAYLAFVQERILNASGLSKAQQWSHQDPLIAIV